MSATTTTTPASSSSTGMSSWTRRFTQNLNLKATIAELSNEECSASDEMSVMSTRSNLLKHGSLRVGFLPKVSEDGATDDGNATVASEVTMDPFLSFGPRGGGPSHRPTGMISYQRQEDIMNDEFKTQLQERNVRIKELEQAQKTDREEVETLRKQLKETKFKYQKESQEWKLNEQDYQNQTHRLTERIEAFDRDWHDDIAMEKTSQDVASIMEDDSSTAAETVSTNRSGGLGQLIMAGRRAFANNNSNNSGRDSNHEISNDSGDMISARSGYNASNGGSSALLDSQSSSQGDQHASPNLVRTWQGRLSKAHHKIFVLQQQLELMERTLEEETGDLREMIRRQQEAQALSEADYQSKLERADLEKRQAEQSLLVHLEAKQERVTYLEDTIEQLREASAAKAAAGTLDREEFGSIVALNRMKEQFDQLSRKKDEMERELFGQVEQMQGELQRLRGENERKQRVIERMRRGDELTVLENEMEGMDEEEHDDDNKDEVGNGGYENFEGVGLRFEQTSRPMLIPQKSLGAMSVLSMRDDPADAFMFPTADEDTDPHAPPPQNISPHELRRKSVNLQEAKLATMDVRKRQQQQSRLNRFL